MGARTRCMLLLNAATKTKWKTSIKMKWLNKTSKFYQSCHSAYWEIYWYFPHRNTGKLNEVEILRSHSTGLHTRGLLSRYSEWCHCPACHQISNLSQPLIPPSCPFSSPIHPPSVLDDQETSSETSQLWLTTGLPPKKCCFIPGQGTVLAHASASVSCSAAPDFLYPMWAEAHKAPLCPWDFPGKDTGVCCRFLLL